jgi:serine/threonine-protein kinase
MATLLEQRYRVDAPLARGGMSAVYRGMDTRLERPVAIKVMDHRFAEDRSFVDRFEREARAAASLHHPNVIAVHDQGFDGDHVFLVMELVDGGTLRDLLIERGRLTVPLALSVLEPVLSALSAAHRAGLVHRDVKPENVLIGKQGMVKVGDFGLVKAMASAGNTSNSVILGTVAYLSPEQVTTGATTARGDVYSAGVLLYEMLTGTPPYVGDTPLSVAYRHVNDDVPPPSLLAPGIPHALDELVVRATRRDPAARPADAAVFLQELEQVRTMIGSPVVQIPSPVHGQQTLPRNVEFPTVQTVPVAPPHASVPGPQGTKAMLRSDLNSASPMQPRTAPPTGSPRPPKQGTPKPGRPSLGSGRKPPKWMIIATAIVLVAGIGTYFLTRTEPVAIPNVVGKDSAAATTEIQCRAGAQRHHRQEQGDPHRPGHRDAEPRLRGQRLRLGRAADRAGGHGWRHRPGRGAGAQGAGPQADPERRGGRVRQQRAQGRGAERLAEPGYAAQTRRRRDDRGEQGPGAAQTAARRPGQVRERGP